MQKSYLTVHGLQIVGGARPISFVAEQGVAEQGEQEVFSISNHKHLQRSRETMLKGFGAPIPHCFCYKLFLGPRHAPTNSALGTRN